MPAIPSGIFAIIYQRQGSNKHYPGSGISEPQATLQRNMAGFFCYCPLCLRIVFLWIPSTACKSKAASQASGSAAHGFPAL